MKKKEHWKITAGAAGTVCAIALALLPFSKAGAGGETSDSTSALSDIRTYTYWTYYFAEKIDTSLTAVLLCLNQWLITPSKSGNDTTGTLQSNFATYTNTILQNANVNNDLQKDLTKAFLGPEVTPANAPDIAPYINDVTYQTLLGIPFYKIDPSITLPSLQNGLKVDIKMNNVDSARNYIFNAAGLNIKHVLPRDSWKGNEEYKQKYTDFYKTVSSIQTFNIHVLGELYADYKSGGAASSQQTNLIQQASSSSWFATVASESIGLVLRQILMYNSQLLVVNTQMLQTQKEMLAAQAMTNTLLVLGNQFNENLLLSNASGQSAT